MKYQKIYKIIELYDYISFDIFDTLIKRDVVKPIDVFFLVEKKLNNMGIIVNYYTKKRMQAEQNARNNLPNEEVTLSNIYDFFRRENNEYTEQDIAIIKNVEEETEIEISTMNLNIKPILEYCRDQKKKIVLISDMYLEKHVIEKILEKNNIFKKRDYKEVFISCISGYTKHSGKLFDEALNYLNISARQLCHIGDASRGDYLVPIKKGIKACHIPTFVNNTNYRYLRSDDRNIRKNELWLDTFISNRILKIDDKYEKFGYECLGPMLYDFSVWLHNNFENRGYKVYNFFAREGLLLQKAFKIVYPEEETRYLCVSRKSIIGAILCKADSLEERLKIIKVPHAFTKKVVIDLLGLESQKYEGDIKSEYDKKYHSIEEVIKDEKFFKFLKSIDDDVIKESEKQMELLKKYLKFNEENDDIGIIDIGWNGTMQNYLGDFLEYIGIDKTIKGYYLGVSYVSRKKYEKIDNYGYLFGKVPDDEHIDENKLFSFCGLFESIFTADHGSVKKYKELDDGEVEPVFFDYEYEENYKVISKIQKGALKFIEDFGKSIIRDYLYMDCKLVTSKILRVGNYPRKEDLSMFESLDFFDAQRGKMIGELKLFRDSLKDIHNEFLISGWKVGFIKRLMYIFPASYFYCNYRKRVNRETKNEESVTG